MWRPKGWPIRRPHIGHVMPYIKGDSMAIIRFVLRVLRIGWLDQNTQCTGDGWPLVVHWDLMEKNGYGWKWTGRYVRRHGRKIEERVRVRKPFRVHEHTLADALLFRESEYGGRRPRMLLDHWRLGARLGMKFAQEVKGSPGFRLPLVWQRMAEMARQTGVKAVITTLTSIPGWKARCEQALAIGFPVAVLERDMTDADRQWCRDRGIALW